MRNKNVKQLARFMYYQTKHFSAFRDSLAKVAKEDSWTDRVFTGMLTRAENALMEVTHTIASDYPEIKVQVYDANKLEDSLEKILLKLDRVMSRDGRDPGLRANIQDVTRSLDDYIRTFIAGVIVSTKLYTEALLSSMDGRVLDTWKVFDRRINSITDYMVKWDIIHIDNKEMRLCGK